MNGVPGHNAALYGYTGPWRTWYIRTNVGMNHAPGTGSIAQHVLAIKLATTLFSHITTVDNYMPLEMKKCV